METKLVKELMPNPRWTHDRKLCRDFLGMVGVDEAGRGCLAGPVVAGCVVLPSEFFSQTNNRRIVEKINDSKQFDEATREELFGHIHSLIDNGKLIGATGSASVLEIEEHNIVGATCLAMQRAMESASERSSGLWSPLFKREEDLFNKVIEVQTKWQVLVDGRPMKRLIYEHDGLVKGDTISLAIAMASLLAKVTRDRLMKKLNNYFPDYGFSSNKGYGTPVHLEALTKLGPTEHHRPRFLLNLMKEPLSEEKVEIEQTQLSLI